jgi:hypothetical protein
MDQPAENRSNRRAVTVHPSTLLRRIFIADLKAAVKATKER